MEAKIHPQATDIEDVVLGAILIESSAMAEVCQVLKEESFYNSNNQKVWKACYELYKSSVPIDLTTVLQQLKKQGDDSINGYYLSELTCRVTSSAHIETHARILEEHAIRRAMIRLSAEASEKAYNQTEDIFESIESIEKSISDITEKKISKNVLSAYEAYILSIEDIERRKNSNTKNKVIGIPSGFNTVDNMTFGWQNSCLYIIAARPGMGKSAFMLACARNAAIDNKFPVAIFSLEMSTKQLMQRLQSSEEEIDLSKIKSGQLEDWEFNKLLNNSKLSQAPIYIDDTAGLNIIELRAKARRLKNKYNISCLFVDYLQLMEGDRSKYKGNREQEISQISRGLKMIAKDLDISVIALAQLSRSVEQRGGDKIPLLSDLRESGSIEQDADFVGFLLRPEYYGVMEDSEGNNMRGMAKLIIAKQRDGSTGHCLMKFNKRYVTFENFNDNDYIAEKPKKPNF